MFGRSLVLQARIARSFSTTPVPYAGHNKWSKIKDKKGANDTQKSLLYGSARRDIVVAARTGGTTDPSQNAQLGAILKKYKDQGVPKENLEKALAKAGGKDKAAGESVLYEAMAFGSVGIIVECLTDNATRTVHSVRHALTRHEGRLAPVKFMFERKGRVTVSLDNSLADRDKVIEDLIETALLADAEDFDQQIDDEDVNTLIVKFICPPGVLSKVAESVSTFNLSSVTLQSSELIYRPTEPVGSSEELEAKISALVEELESDEDTLRVWTSLDSR